MDRVRSKRASLTARGFPAARPRVGAFTLIELLVVCIVIAALAALVVSKVDNAAEDAEMIAARATMQTVAEAFTGSPAAPGYFADMKYVPGFQPAGIKTRDLLTSVAYPDFDEFDPTTRRGWRGPYIRNANGIFPANGGFDPTYGTAGEPTVLDPWGNPIVVQVPTHSSDPAERFRYARLVSAGSDGALSTDLADPLAGRTAQGTSRGDDLVLFLNRNDVYEAEEP